MKKPLYFFLFSFFFFSSNANAQIITTITGNGSSVCSGDGGQALLATLRPHDVQVDRVGNIYIADESNARIRKIDTSGIIITIAGNGTTGFSGDGGLATNAKLNNPNAMVIDRFGNIYIADGPNNRIRKVDTLGIIKTIAGTGANGYYGDGGLAVDADIADAYSVAVDTFGNIYIADSYNDVIRKINTSGIITTIAGNATAGFSGDGGPATAGQLSFPTGVILDDTGNIYIADASNNRIRKVSVSGIISTVAGSGTVGTIPSGITGSYSGDGGPATGATLNTPFKIALDHYGNMFIADAWNYRVRKVNSAGIISTVAGDGIAGFSGDGDTATLAEITTPVGVGLDNNEDLFIADLANNRIRKVRNGTGDGTTRIMSVNSFSNSKITIYPNPNAGAFSLTISSLSDEKASVVITNVLGEKVKELITITNKPLEVGIDVPTGVYFVSVTTSDGISNRQVVIR